MKISKITVFILYSLLIIFCIIGSGKDTLMFIHGTPSTMYAFVEDLEHFTDYFTMIFFDQRGGGRSSLILDPDSLSWKENVSDIEALRNYFKIDKLNLMGISWGSALSILYANQYPDKVKNLILFTMRARKNYDTQEAGGGFYSLFDSTQTKRLIEILGEWENSENPV